MPKPKTENNTKVSFSLTEGVGLALPETPNGVHGPDLETPSPTSHFVRSSSQIEDWDSLQSVAVPTAEPSLIDRIVSDMREQNQTVASFTLDVNGYTGVLKATTAKVPRLAMKILSVSGKGQDRRYSVAIKRLEA